MTIDYKQYPVLFVDDEEANRVVFKAAFGRDFNVLITSRAAEALAVLKEQKVAVLIADQRMPDLTGVDLIEIVRDKYPDIIRILVTAYSDTRTAVDAINRGQVWRYISKPWNGDEVHAYMRQAIEHYQLGHQVEELQSQVLRSERLATLGLAASSIAHDLGGPLACLLNNLEAMSYDLANLIGRAQRGDLTVAQLDELGDMIKDCKSASMEIARILDAVRTSIRFEHRAEPVQLSTVVKTALRLVKTEVAARATLHMECDEQVWVCGEGAALVQVVINLLVNAAGFFPERPGSKNEIHLSVFSYGDKAMLRVADNGCGIPPELTERIFEPLFTTRADKGGTGLGLSIVRRIVERHQGTIGVDSTVDRGSVFTVTLPRIIGT